MITLRHHVFKLLEIMCLHFLQSNSAQPCVLKQSVFPRGLCACTSVILVVKFFGRLLKCHVLKYLELLRLFYKVIPLSLVS